MKSLKNNLATGLIAVMALSSLVTGSEAKSRRGSTGQSDYYHVHTKGNPRHLWIHTKNGYTNHSRFIGGHTHYESTGIFSRPTESELRKAHEAVREAEGVRIRIERDPNRTFRIEEYMDGYYIHENNSGEKQ